jgi:hypothetical protein
MTWCIDATYIKPNGYREYGLVDYPPGAEPTTPTLFIGAYCKTERDERLLKMAVALFTKETPR